MFSKEELKDAIKSRFIKGIDDDQQSAILAGYFQDLMNLTLSKIKDWIEKKKKTVTSAFENAESNRLEDGDVSFCGTVNYMEDMAYCQGIINVLDELNDLL